MLKLARSRIMKRVGQDADVQVVLVLDQTPNVLVLFADVRSPESMTKSFEWFVVQGGTGSVTSLSTARVCDPVLRSRPISSSSALLGDLSQFVAIPTRDQMQDFMDMCITRESPQDQTLPEVSDFA